MKRIIKVFFKVMLSLLLLATAAYGGFHLWEYATGGKYIQYLKDNSETIPLEQSFAFETLDKDLAKNRLILVGEIHGFNAPQQFDVDLFKHLHGKHGVRHYFAELDFFQAELLNQYLDSGDEATLARALEKWAVLQGRQNKDYFEKYRKFQTYYSQLPDDEKFKFIGVDAIRDLSLVSDYLQTMMPSTGDTASISMTVDSLSMQVERLALLFAASPDTLFRLSHIRTNLSYLQQKANRERVLFENFQALYKKFNPERNKAYGFFGLYHVFQYRVNGNHPLASQLRTSDLGLENQLLSINFLMNDSYMVRPSNQLPAFMRDPGLYTRMPVSADNMLFLYIYGVKDFKRMTPEYHKSLVKMDANDSPYAMSGRLNTNIQLLPVTELYEMDDKGKPYVQYTVFVRNSDWAEPMQ